MSRYECHKSTKTKIGPISSSDNAIRVKRIIIKKATLFQKREKKMYVSVNERHIFEFVNIQTEIEIAVAKMSRYIRIMFIFVLSANRRIFIVCMFFFSSSYLFIQLFYFYVLSQTI